MFTFSYCPEYGPTWNCNIIGCIRIKRIITNKAIMQKQDSDPAKMLEKVTIQFKINNSLPYE